METVNTILYQPIEIACWEKLRANALIAMNWLEAGDAYHVYNMSHKKFNQDVIKEVEDEMSVFSGKKVSVVESLIFQSRPNENPVIHVDGKDLDRTKASQVALNIPILNCKDSHMIWYDGEYDLSVHPTGSNPEVYSLGLKWHKGPNEVFCQEIDRPALVRVNVPHRVVNQQPKPRVMLSMRFAPALTFSSSLPYYGY